MERVLTVINFCFAFEWQLFKCGVNHRHKTSVFPFNFYHITKVQPQLIVEYKSLFYFKRKMRRF